MWSATDVQLQCNTDAESIGTALVTHYTDAAWWEQRPRAWQESDRVYVSTAAATRNPKSPEGGGSRAQFMLSFSVDGPMPHKMRH